MSSFSFIFLESPKSMSLITDVSSGFFKRKFSGFKSLSEYENNEKKKETCGKYHDHDNI